MKNMINAIAKYIASPFLVLFSNGKYLLILFGYINHMKHAVVDISNPAMFIGDVSQSPCVYPKQQQIDSTGQQQLGS